MVKKYNCEKCGKEFKQKSHYTTHLKRKTPCINIINPRINLLEPQLIINDVDPNINDVDPNINDVDPNINDVDPIINDDKLNVLDLFCGCGGMSKGITDAGLNVIAGIDIWDKAINSYKKNYEHKAICHDLTQLPPEVFSRTHEVNSTSIDVIVGGPPCQSYSNAGRRDVNDPRNSLFMEFVKYLDYFKPKAFIMENVIGILSKKTGTNELVIDIIMSHLKKDHNCIICKLYASDFEVPQNRRRVIIIGIRKNLNIDPTEPKVILKTHERIPVKTILLKKQEVAKSQFLSTTAIQGIKNKKQKSLEKGAGFGAQFLDLEKPSFTIPARYHKDGYDALVKYTDNEIRRLTILELKRIQSFPDNYIIEGSKKDIIMQIGNAVACRFAFHLGNHIKNLLGY
jgi:DNA (cytosine-5)-methyltransferase 1